MVIGILQLVLRKHGQEATSKPGRKAVVARTHAVAVDVSIYTVGAGSLDELERRQRWWRRRSLGKTIRKFSSR